MSKKYECGEFTICEITFEIPIPQVPIKLPDHYSEIFKAKKRLAGYPKKCECGSVGTPRFIKEKRECQHTSGYVEYLDYTVERILCSECNEKYLRYQDHAEFQNNQISKLPT